MLFTAKEICASLYLLLVRAIWLHGANFLDYDKIHQQNENKGESVESVNGRVVVPRVENGG